MRDAKRSGIEQESKLCYQRCSGLLSNCRKRHKCLLCRHLRWARDRLGAFFYWKGEHPFSVPARG